MTKNINIRKSLDFQTKDLLKKLLCIDDTKRIDIDQVLQHPALVSNLENFKNPIEERDFSILIRNYMLNTEGNMGKALPDALDKLLYKMAPL